jgi:phage gpG-like protein
MPQAFDAGMEAGIRAATIDITAHVKNLISGPVLNRRTHRLWKSIQPEVFRRFGRVIGIVGTDVIYAPVHEFGATIRPKEPGGKLVFSVAGERGRDSSGRFTAAEDQTIFADEVTIPRRPFMSRAFEERKGRVRQLIRENVMKAARGALDTGKVLPPSLRRGVGFNANLG